MPVIAKCRECGKQYRLRDDQAGSVLPCKACGADFRVPGAARKPAPARPARPRRSAPPAPYRVTIKLPAADPSAPAEVLTQALRAAGLAFEVETIERVPNGTTPTRSAAPDPR